MSFDIRATRSAVVALLLMLVLILLPACSGPSEGGDSTAPAGNSTATTQGAQPVTATATTQAVISTATATTAAVATATATPSPASTPAAVPTEPAPSPTEEAETLTLSVYFIRDEKIATAHREVPRTLQVAAAAMEQLLAGPTEAEQLAGLSTAIPQGTEYLGTTIDDGSATVDLSGEFESGGGSFSMAARLAQVVYTLTQFPTVDNVRFMLNGEPVTVFGGEGLVMDRPVDRSNYEELTPLIFVESPAVFDVVDDPLRVYGTANTFEAMFQLQVLTEDGELLFDEPMMATSGSGTRGTFDVSVPLDAEPGTPAILRVFEYSARDGSEVHVVEIPITIGE